MEHRVIICGYPKSGNTWLTRLTAEIVGCPVTGFWSQPSNKEQAIEGDDRSSNYQCFKAHHSIQSLEQTMRDYGNGSEKLIYIYRDPRAVAVSAAHYFAIPKYRRIQRSLSIVPLGLGIYNKLIHRYSHSLDHVVRGMVNGTKEGFWLAEPWQEHVQSYIQRPEILSLSFELLKQEPLSVARQVAEFLSIERTDQQLEEAILAQSFERKKRSLAAQGKARIAKHLRRGDSEAWREELPENQVVYLESHMGEFMSSLGYTLVSQ